MTNFVNENELVEEFEDSFDILEMMLPKFEVGVRESVEKVAKLLAGSDTKALSEELHSLKGMVANFYAEELYQSVVDMEQTAKQGSTDGLAEKLKQVQSLYPQVIEEVRGLLLKHAS